MWNSRSDSVKSSEGSDWQASQGPLAVVYQWRNTARTQETTVVVSFSRTFCLSTST